jgi:hypothetical protein
MWAKVNSGERCGPWASCYLMYDSLVLFVVCLFVHILTSNFSAIWWLLPLPAANLDLCLARTDFSSEDFFYMPHLLQHETSVYTVSSERLTPTSHSGIRTRNIRIIRSLYHRSNHCAGGGQLLSVVIHE